MRPSYRRRPSQTASAALDRGIEGADPRAVAVDQLAVDVDEQVGVPGVGLLQHGWVRGSAGRLIRRRAGARQGDRSGVGTPREHRPGSRAPAGSWDGRGAKPVLFSTAPYQCGAQIPSVSRRPGGQLSIVSSNSAPTARHRLSRPARGFRNTSAESMTAGGAGRAARTPGRTAPAAAAGRCRAAWAAGGSGSATSASRPGRGSGRHSSAGLPMTGHRAAGDAPCASGRRSAGLLARPRASHFVTRSRSLSWWARMSSRPGWSWPWSTQVVRVQGLVADEGVVAVSPGAQHGRRDIARPGPHGDPKDGCSRSFGVDHGLHSTASSRRQLPWSA